MAAPTSTIATDPNYTVDVTGNNVTIATYTYPLERAGGRLEAGFSIHTGTLTNCDVKILASNNDSYTAYDLTNDLFGVPVLAANTIYWIALSAAFKTMSISATPTNATNDVNFSLFVPKGRS